MATLIYAYAESTAVVGPLAPIAEPHAWDLCERHSAHITAPVGWDLVRVEHVDISDEDGNVLDPEEAELTALAEAVREAGRVTTGLVDHTQDPIEYEANHDYHDADTSNHPVYRRKRVEEQLSAHKAARRAHLQVVPDPDESDEGVQ